MGYADFRGDSAIIDIDCAMAVMDTQTMRSNFLYFKESLSVVYLGARDARRRGLCCREPVSCLLAGDHVMKVMEACRCDAW